MTSRLRPVLAVVAGVGALALLGTSSPQPARADDATGTVNVSLTNVTGSARVPPNVIFFDQNGSEVDEESPADGVSGTTFEYDSSQLPVGTYKIGVSFNFYQDYWGRNGYGPRNASFFYSLHGDTTAWTKATSVTVAAGAATSVSVATASGTHVTGTMRGEWADGADLDLVPVGAPKDAVQIGWGNLQDYDYGTHKFVSTAVLPGRYRIASGTDNGTRYYTGSKKKAAKTLSGGKIIVIHAGTKKLSIGTFNAG